MNAIKNVKSSVHAKATAEKTVFTTKDVADMLGLSLSGFSSYLFLHKELRTPTANSWTIEQIDRILQLRNSKNKNKENTPLTAITTSEKTYMYQQIQLSQKH